MQTCEPQMDEDLKWKSDTKASTLLHLLIPECSVSVYDSFERVGLNTAGDLARLGREELRELGLTMGERVHLLRWAAEFETHGQDRESEVATQPEMHDRDTVRRLDNLDNQTGFWLSLVNASDQPFGSHLEGRPPLEKIIDFTQERLKEIYNDILDISGGNFHVTELALGLLRSGQITLDEKRLSQILQKVSEGRKHMEFTEFACTVSGLKIAQLLCDDTVGNNGEYLAAQVTVTDYATTVNRQECKKKSELRKLVLSSTPTAPLVRWLHIDAGVSSLADDLDMLLALAVKYSLHPLAVEDVLERQHSKLERFGCHYFTAINHLCLAHTYSLADAEACRPVEVSAHHVSLFCTAAPHFNTLISIVQKDSSFRDEWPVPDGTTLVEKGMSLWADKLQRRLNAKGCTFRGRKGNALLHQIFDLCANDLVNIVVAYTTWVMALRNQVDRIEIGAEDHEKWLNRFSHCQLQLDVVVRRIKSLLRVLKTIRIDKELAEADGYWQDVVGHLDDAFEDGLQAKEWCTYLSSIFKDKVRKEYEASTSHISDWMQRVLSLLTIVTSLFAPAHFIAGVYGMNFDSIPELSIRYGYIYFWLGILIYFILCAVAVWWFKRNFKRSLDELCSGFDVDDLPSTDDIDTPRGISNAYPFTNIRTSW